MENIYKIKEETLNKISNSIQEKTNNFMPIDTIDFARQIYYFCGFPSAMSFEPSELSVRYSSKIPWPPDPNTYVYYLKNNYQKDILENHMNSLFLFPQLISKINSRPLLAYFIPSNSAFNFKILDNNLSIGYNYRSIYFIYGINHTWSLCNYFSYVYRNKMSNIQILQELNNINIDIIDDNMSYTFFNQRSTPLNFIFCYDHITNFSYCYTNCNFTDDITGPICGPNVTNMAGTYQAVNIKGIPVCGPNVIDMRNTYRDSNIKGAPVCGPNVIYMDNTYAGTDVSGSPVCGDKVIHFNHTYSWANITGKSVCGPNVKYMIGTYQNTKVNSINIGPNVISASGAYSWCTNLDNLDIYKYVSSSLINIGGIFSWMSNNKLLTNWSGFPDDDIPIQNYCALFTHSFILGQYDLIPTKNYWFGKHARDISGAFRYIYKASYAIPTFNCPKTTDNLVKWQEAFSTNRSTKWYGNLYVTNEKANLYKIVNGRHTTQWLELLNFYVHPNVFEDLRAKGSSWLVNGAKGGWTSASSSTLWAANWNIYVHNLG